MTGRARATDIVSPDLRVVVSQHGTTSPIQVAGAWDPAAQERGRHAAVQALGRHPENLVLDLRRATSMDATGIALVTGLAKRCTGVGW